MLFVSAVYVYKYDIYIYILYILIFVGVKLYTYIYMFDEFIDQSIQFYSMYLLYNTGKNKRRRRGDS